MENAANWRTESRTVYSNDFKLRMVELASRPDANVAQLAREHGVDNNLIFKWLPYCAGLFRLRSRQKTGPSISVSMSGHGTGATDTER